MDVDCCSAFGVWENEHVLTSQHKAILGPTSATGCQKTVLVSTVLGSKSVLAGLGALCHALLLFGLGPPVVPFLTPFLVGRVALLK